MRLSDFKQGTRRAKPKPNHPDKMKTLPKMQSSLQTAQHLNAMVAALSRESDLEVVRDNEAGTVAVSVKGRNLTVFRAIEKQKGGAWIVSARAGLLSQI